MAAETGITSAFLERHSHINAGTIGHLTTEGFLDRDIRPVGSAVRFVGRALTVSCQPTDSAEIEEVGLPVFARNLSALTTRRLNLPGTVGEPVVCAGVHVCSGDIVLADNDGVVVIPAARAEPLLRQARRFEEWEEVMRAGLIAGLSPAEARERADAAVDRSVY